MMTKRISMAAAALLAMTLGVGVALAQSNQAPSFSAPMMQRGADKSGMMDMSKMNRMMDNCSRMMEGMQQHPPSDPGTVTPNNGGSSVPPLVGRRAAGFNRIQPEPRKRLWSEKGYCHV
jgi:hypothetical protein